MAKETGALSYTTHDSSQLAKVFAAIPKEVKKVQQRHEVTATFAAIAALLVLGAISAALRFSPYP